MAKRRTSFWPNIFKNCKYLVCHTNCVRGPNLPYGSSVGNLSKPYRTWSLRNMAISNGGEPGKWSPSERLNQMWKGWPESECCYEGSKPAVNGGPVPGMRVARARLSEGPKPYVVVEGTRPRVWGWWSLLGVGTRRQQWQKQSSLVTESLACWTSDP